MDPIDDESEVFWAEAHICVICRMTLTWTKIRATRLDGTGRQWRREGYMCKPCADSDLGWVEV